MYNYRLRSTIDARFESHVLDMLFCPCWCISLAFGRAINCPSVTNSFVHLNLTLVVPVISVNSTHLYCYLSALVSWSFLKTCLINSSRFRFFCRYCWHPPIHGWTNIWGPTYRCNFVEFGDLHYSPWKKLEQNGYFSLASNMPHA